MLECPHDLRGSYAGNESEGETTDSYIESSDEDIAQPEEDLLIDDNRKDLTKLTGRSGNISVIYHCQLYSSKKPASTAAESSV